MKTRGSKRAGIFQNQTFAGQKKESPKKSHGLFGALFSSRPPKKKESIWDDELEEELDMDEDMWDDDDD